MAEVEILFPTVQYGNVKLRVTPEELGLDGPADAYAFGVQSAVLLNLFTQGFKVGSQLDVEHDDGGPKPPPPAPILPVGADGAAEQRVHDDLKPRTVDEANAMARAVIERELGSTTEVGNYSEPKEDLYRELPNNGDGPEVDEYDSATEAKEAAQARYQAAYDAAYSAPNDGPEPAPWESTVDAKPKPWETGKAAPTNAVKVAEINW